MMGDYDALNHTAQLTTRRITHRDPATGNKEFLMHIAQKQKHDTPENIQQYLMKLIMQHAQTTKLHDIQQQETPDNVEMRNIMENNKKKPTKTAKTWNAKAKSKNRTYRKQTPTIKAMTTLYMPTTQTSYAKMRRFDNSPPNETLPNTHNNQNGTHTMGKAHLLTRKKRHKTQQTLPNPFNRIQTTTGTILGKR